MLGDNLTELQDLLERNEPVGDCELHSRPIPVVCFCSDLATIFGDTQREVVAPTATLRVPARRRRSDVGRRRRSDVGRRRRSE